MKQYLDLVQHVLDNGTRKPNRTGVDTLSTFNYNYEHDLANGFPLLTTKSVSWKNIVVEILWFLSGQTDISILKRHGCRFWDSWADADGKVPSAYGSYWRHFPAWHLEPTSDDDRARLQIPDNWGMKGRVVPTTNDQIRWAIDELKRNPMSRRVVISAWAPGNAQTSKLPPCHCLFIFNVQNDLSRSSVAEQRLCLHLTQRSCDVALGVPYNIASYALLVHLFSRFTGIEPGIFAHTLVDAHIYTAKADGEKAEFDHVPGLREQLRRVPQRLPKLAISSAIQTIHDVEKLMHEDISTEEVMQHFVLDGYDPQPAIPFKVAV